MKILLLIPLLLLLGFSVPAIAHNEANSVGVEEMAYDSADEEGKDEDGKDEGGGEKRFD